MITKEEALGKARELELDLIEVAPQANPPVARIFDYQKFKYEEGKKERGSRKGSEGGLKELWLSPRIADHDLQVRLNRTEEFIKQGQKVKLTVKFKGREMAHTEVGHRVLEKALSLLGDKVSVERDPKFEGRKLSIILSKGIKKESQEKTDAETKN